MSTDLIERAAPRAASIGAAPAPRVLLFLGDTTEPGYAKTAFGLRDWAGDRCVGEMALAGASVTTGLRRLTPADAASLGAQALLIGVAAPGGLLPEAWRDSLFAAVEAGLDVISGMHARLADVPGLPAAAARNGRRLIDVRVPPDDIRVATGVKRTGRRLLTVGTDCALGKKYTALAIAAGLQGRGIDATFRATGQTGIMIAGQGIPIDAVIADFVSGAAEMLTPDAAPDHVDVVEGQGSLFHPAYAAVSLGLLHGSQPDLFVVCHDPRRTHILGLPSYPIPTIEAVIAQTIAAGRLTNPAIRCLGVSLNTGGMTPDEAAAAIETVGRRSGLPTADPIRGGAAFKRLLDACR